MPTNRLLCREQPPPPKDAVASIDFIVPLIVEDQVMRGRVDATSDLVVADGVMRADASAPDFARILAMKHYCQRRATGLVSHAGTTSSGSVNHIENTVRLGRVLEADSVA